MCFFPACCWILRLSAGALMLNPAVSALVAQVDAGEVVQSVNLVQGLCGWRAAGILLNDEDVDVEN